MNLDFKKMVEASLDKDIGSLFEQGRINTTEALNLQMLRIMRGRPFFVDLQPPPQTGGWSADGVTWLPAAPGNTTTGNGPIPPVKGE